jgi:hypothetical protein
MERTGFGTDRVYIMNTIEMKYRSLLNVSVTVKTVRKSGESGP